MAASVVVVVPIYKDALDPSEQFSLDYSRKALSGREVRFIAPQALKEGYYRERYPTVPIDRFAAPAFESIPEYNRLLLSSDFYHRYSDRAFMLVLQTDAIVLRDELDYWCAQPFDYVGAPWPKAFELLLQTGRFQGDFSKHVHTHVGNGGFSLRRNRKCIKLLQEFPVETDLFLRAGSSEDLFFSVMGTISGDFVMPNEVTASCFAMEGRPSFYFQINGGKLPMGAHAWEINEQEFWRAQLCLPQAS
jgi:hypothetical protein